MNAVKQEITGFRDEWISRRHRDWGRDCPAVDIDFLMVEFDRGVPCALVEYKKHNAPRITSSHPSIRAIVYLADNSRIPVFGTRYNSTGDVWFRPTALNRYALELLPEPRQMTEREWVELLYKCRDREIPNKLAVSLN